MKLVRWAADVLAASWRTEVVGQETLTEARSARVPVILAVWHGQLLPALMRHRGDGTTLLVSGHRDGGYLADAARQWGFTVARGSSTRDGTTGLRALVRALREGRTVGITPDGPRGPAREAKPGVLAAAELTGASIIPVGAAASRAWHAGSWDQFLVPAPFARVRVVYGTAIRIERNSGHRGGAIRQLNRALNDASDAARCRA